MRSGWCWLWVTLLLAGCAAPVFVPTPTPLPPVGPAQTLRLMGSESVEPLLRALAAAYQREHSLVQVVVLKRADSLAWKALQEGEADLAILTWWPNSLPADTWMAPLARDGIAIVVNSQNGIPGLTLEQLRMLFQGRVEDWAPWGGLPGVPVLVTREDASGETLFFQQRVMGDFPLALTALMAPTSESLLDVVMQEPLAVGYISTARLNGRARALALEGVPPVPEMLAAGLYPLTREIMMVAREEPQDALADFVVWLGSERARAIVQQQGFLLPPSP